MCLAPSLPLAILQLLLHTHMHRLYFWITQAGVTKRTLQGTGIMLWDFPAFRTVSQIDFCSLKITQSLAVCYIKRKQAETHPQRSFNDHGEVVCPSCPTQWPLATCALEH